MYSSCLNPSVDSDLNSQAFADFRTKSYMSVLFSSLLMWGVYGGLYTMFDEVHTYIGIMDHSQNWVHDYPFFRIMSPNFMLGGMMFFLIFVFFSQKPLSHFTLFRVEFVGTKDTPKKMLQSFIMSIFIYASSVVIYKWIDPSMVLFGVFLAILRMIKWRSNIPLFIWAIAIVGTGAEFIFTYFMPKTTFSYNVCQPDNSCVFLSVPFWLFQIYEIAGNCVEYILS